MLVEEFGCQRYSFLCGDRSVGPYLQGKLIVVGDLSYTGIIHCVVHLEYRCIDAVNSDYSDGHISLLLHYGLVLLGGDIALGHRLQGEAEAAAHQRQHQHHAPLGGGGGEPGLLKQEGRPKAQQPQKAQLQNAKQQGIILPGEAGGEQNGAGVEQRGGQAQQLAPPKGGDAALQREKAHAQKGQPRAAEIPPPRRPAAQQRRQQRHPDDGGVLQKGGGGGVGGAQAEELRRHHCEKAGAKEEAVEHRPQLDAPKTPAEEQHQQPEGDGEAQPQKVERIQRTHTQLREQQRGGPCHNDPRQQQLRVSLFHNDPSRFFLTRV